MRVSKVVLFQRKAAGIVEACRWEDCVEPDSLASVFTDLVFANQGRSMDSILYSVSAKALGEGFALLELEGSDWNRASLNKLPCLIRARLNPASRPLFLERRISLNEQQIFFDPTQRGWENLEIFRGSGIDNFVKSLEAAPYLAFVIRVFRLADGSRNFAKDIRFVYQEHKTLHWHIVVTALSENFRNAFLPNKVANTNLTPQEESADSVFVVA